MTPYLKTRLTPVKLKPPPQEAPIDAHYQASIWNNKVTVHLEASVK